MPAEGTNQMTLLPSPATVKAPAEQFTGDVWVDGITSAAGDGTATLAAVRFCPGARTAWHAHEHGQTLRITDGVGIVQSRDGQTIVMHPGDTVETLALIHISEPTRHLKISYAGFVLLIKKVLHVPCKLDS